VDSDDDVRRWAANWVGVAYGDLAMARDQPTSDTKLWSDADLAEIVRAKWAAAITGDPEVPWKHGGIAYASGGPIGFLRYVKVRTRK
jgi:hypothetical protein